MRGPAPSHLLAAEQMRQQPFPPATPARNAPPPPTETLPVETPGDGDPSLSAPCLHPQGCGPTASIPTGLFFPLSLAKPAPRHHAPRGDTSSGPNSGFGSLALPFLPALSFPRGLHPAPPLPRKQCL